MTGQVEEILQKLEHFCAYQDRSWKEVEDKLRTFNLIPEAREKILLHLSHYRFVDEERFALNFAVSKFHQKKWGKRKIAYKLSQKQVGKKLIEIALNAIPQDEYRETMQRVYHQKEHELRSEKNPWTRKQKLLRFMQQRGFSYTEIQENIPVCD